MSSIPGLAIKNQPNRLPSFVSNLAWYRRFRNFAVIAVLTVMLMRSGFAQTRVAVSSPRRQAEIRKLLDEAFELPKANSADRKQKAVKALLDLAADSATPPDDAYVALQAALPWIKEAADIVQLRKVIDRLERTFEVDGPAERMKQVPEALAACKSKSSFDKAVAEVLSMAQDAARANRFAEARTLLEAADKSAKRLMDKNAVSVLSDAQRTVLQREEDFELQSKARKSLARDPGDADANLIVGKWLAVHEQDWEQAFAYLSKGSDAKWQLAASEEFKIPATTDDRLAVADAWWEVAQVATGTAKLAVQRHAIGWYETVAAEETTPLVRLRVSQRLKDLTQAVRPGEARSEKPAPIPTAANDRELATGVWVDLLEMVQLPGHVLRGKWQRRDGAIGCEQSADARFMTPVAIRGSYELNCEFTRRTNAEAVQLILPLGSTYCTVYLSGWNGASHGLHMINGRDGFALPLTSGAVVRPGKLTNGVRNQLHVKVTLDGRQVAIIATLNGDRFVAWKGTTASLSCPPAQAIPCVHAVAVTVHESATDIHKLELKLKRDAKGYRLGDDWQNPVTAVADGPSKEVAGKCISWHGRKYFVSDKPMDFPAAQLLALELKGRLLTVSSREEDEFILNEGRGVAFWLSGWRQMNSDQWRDERNRPLKYIGQWAEAQPSSTPFAPELHLAIFTANARNRGWHDVPAGAPMHACIEWGEEYP